MQISPVSFSLFQFPDGFQSHLQKSQSGSQQTCLAQHQLLHKQDMYTVTVPVPVCSSLQFKSILGQMGCLHGLQTLIHFCSIGLPSSCVTPQMCLAPTKSCSILKLNYMSVVLLFTLLMFLRLLVKSPICFFFSTLKSPWLFIHSLCTICSAFLPFIKPFVITQQSLLPQ